MQLAIKNTEELSHQDKQELDIYIEETLATQKENSAKINKLVIDSVTALTASESRSEELANQGFFKRFWGGITGKTTKIRSRIDMDLSRSQYASQQMIQKLAEQNLITFETVTLINNKLNSMMIEVDEEINTIYGTLAHFFKKTRSDIIQMESRIDKLEHNINLLYWKGSIEHLVYNNTEYPLLTDIEKICCIVNDFYQIGKGNWSTPDLMLLKSTLSDCGVNVRGTISYKAFFRYLIENTDLIERLFDKINVDDLHNSQVYEVPLLKGIEKSTKIKQDEKYILDSLIEPLENANVPFNKIDLQLTIIHNYLKNSAYIISDKEVNIFELAVELLANIKMIDTNYLNEEPIKQSQSELPLEKEKEIIYTQNTNLQIGDHILFGEREKKTWQVIDISEDSYLLFATYTENIRKVNSIKCLWNECSIRKKLEDWYSNVFDENIYNLILPTKIETVVHGYNCNNEDLESFLVRYEHAEKFTTKDRFFLLSIKELKELVIENNKELTIDRYIDYKFLSPYSLRDYSDAGIPYTDRDGEICTTREFHYSWGPYARPAMYIKKVEFPIGDGTKENPYCLEDFNSSSQIEPNTTEEVLDNPEIKMPILNPFSIVNLINKSIK
ncbi:hypothetical protein CN386_01755 [Bacillus cereus]|nr:hypothetical protein CN386_01755 [Bacillus cereus]